MSMSEYSLSDLALATGNDNMGFGGGSWVVWILLFALLGGNGGFLGGNNRAASVDEVASGFNFSGINNKLNELVAGQSNINQNLGNAICSSTYELGGKIDACCCTTQNLIGQVRYDMAVQNGDLKAMIHSEGEATRNLIQQNKIESLQQQVNQLQLAQATCGIPRINQYAWGVYAYPTCGGYTGCGCGTNI